MHGFWKVKYDFYIICTSTWSVEVGRANQTTTITKSHKIRTKKNKRRIINEAYIVKFGSLNVHVFVCKIAPTTTINKRIDLYYAAAVCYCYR